MTQLRNKFEIEDTEPLDDELLTLPNAFDDTKDEISIGKSILLSLILHPLVVFLIFAIITILGFVLPKVEKPQWKQRDIEFVLVTREAPPINKNTKYRSDKNSRAGGKHDPSKKVSEPTPSASPSPKANKPASPQKQPSKQPKQQPKKQTVKKPVKKSWSEQITQAMKDPVQQVQKAVQQKPAPPKPSQAPSQRPVVKPTNTAPKPSMPKLAANPKSPFSIEVPRSDAPVGASPSAGSGSGSGYSSSGGSSTGRPIGMPSPQFSTSRGSGSGSGGSGSSGKSGTGSYGSGNMGNPGPGNPSGPPGIDAIKSPDWGPYMRELERRIKRNWNPPKGDASKRVVVMFKIGRDGRLLSIRVTKSSTSVTNDDAAKAAIELTAPFKPLPPEFKGSSIDIEFTFDYNVLGASYR